MKILGLRSITVKKFNHAGKSNTDSVKVNIKMYKKLKIKMYKKCN